MPCDSTGGPHDRTITSGNVRARQNFLRGDTRVFIVYAKGTHSRNARETQHGRLAQDESEFLAGVHATQRQHALSLCLLPSLPVPFALRFCPPSPAVYSKSTHSRSVLLARVHYAYRRSAICLRFCTMLLLSFRRFLAFRSALFPRSSFLRLSSSLLPLLFHSARARPLAPPLSLSRPFSPSLLFSPVSCISLSFLSPDRAFHSKIERQRACRAHFSS